MHFNGFASFLQIGCKLTRVQYSNDSLEPEEAKWEIKRSLGRADGATWSETEQVGTTSPFTLPLFFLLCHRMTDVKLLSFRFPLICDSTQLQSLGNIVKPTSRNLDHCYSASQLLHKKNVAHALSNSCKMSSFIASIFSNKTHSSCKLQIKEYGPNECRHFSGDQFYQASSQLTRILYSSAICHGLKLEEYSVAPRATYRHNGKSYIVGRQKGLGVPC